MITVNISENQVNRAKGLYSFKELNGSITKGKSNIFGAVGEILVYDFFKDSTPDFTSTFDYDLIINDFKVDVKTKKTTVVPKPEYLCSISNYNISQQCDYYFFCRVKTDFSTGYLLGYMAKDDFYKYSFFKNKGDLDINGWEFKDDCYNIEISKLIEFSKQ